MTADARPRLRGILFDLDITLADHESGWATLWPEISARLSERFPGFDPDEFERRSWSLSDKHYELLLRGEVDHATYRRNHLREVLEPWGEPDEETFAFYHDARERSMDLVRLYDDALETVRALRARGIKIGVLTNGPSELQRRKLRRLGLEDELDAVAISEEIGAAKPAAAAFHRAVALLGLEPREVAMVGDHRAWDIAGALAAGLGAAVWVDRFGEEQPEGAHLALAIADVPRLLGLVD